jgi:GNAT superfamily N-acetyltransferase
METAKPTDSIQKPEFLCLELTSKTWQDFETLFGKHGAYGGCWCMFFRGIRKDWNENIGEGNRLRLQAIVDQEKPVGLLAYDGEIPVGWCAVAPREDYAALERSRYYKAVDNKKVWSITCFFTAKTYRRKGVTKFLIAEAIKYANGHGAEALEAYPLVPKKESVPDIYAYTGFYQVFIDLGFTVAAMRGEFNPILSYNYT